METSNQAPGTRHLIDTHAHLDSYSDVEEVIERAAQAGVFKMIVAAFDLHCSRFNTKVVADKDGLFASIGVHPHNAKDLDSEAKDELSDLAKEPKVKAIGETGLDYHYLYSTKEVQKDAFKWHIELANKRGLPLIIHSREALDETLEIMEQEGFVKAGFVFHAFSGDMKQAEYIFEKGGLISVTGVVTFKNARDLQELIAEVDLGKIMLETDSPYLTPEPYRGKINEPANVKLVAEKVAALKDLSIDEVATTTTNTAENFFGIKKS